MIRDKLLQRIADNTTVVANPSFQLASGQLSKYFVNLTPVLMCPIGLWEVKMMLTLCIEKEINIEKITHIGGPACGAIPLVTMLIQHYYGRAFPRPLNMKGYWGKVTKSKSGTWCSIEGHGQHLDDATYHLVVDDVVTTGKSIEQTIAAIPQNDNADEIVHIFSIVDRGETPIESRFDYPYTSLFTLDEILDWKKTHLSSNDE